jgi:DNA-binding NtrC family response regulator
MPKIRVLIADDEPLVLDLLREVVSRESCYTVDLAESGEAALKLIENDDYGVIITDLMLHGMSGMDLLKEIKSRSRETQVIMVSGKGTIDLAVEAMKMGAFDFLTKPFSPQHLLQILGRAREHYASLMENKQLRGELRQLRKNYELVGAHASIVRIREIIENIAPSDSTVLIQGRSGTGKELVARAVHNRSPRAEGPFQAVNCGVFADTLIENELFGHERGAYTGASQRAIGRIEASAGGTLFLDEIDTMPLASQVKLLRVLEERTFQRLGGTKPIHVDFRLIAASNTNLKDAVAAKTFREDLYYRLNVITVVVPELRDRVSDIPLLVNHFLALQRDRGRVRTVSPQALDLLIRYPWPGNVRELVNAIEYGVVMARGSQVAPDDLPENIRPSSGSSDEIRSALSLRDTERDIILKTLRDCKGNKHLAAKMLGIPRSSLYSKIHKHGLSLEVSKQDEEEGPEVRKEDRKQHEVAL